MNTKHLKSELFKLIKCLCLSNFSPCEATPITSHLVVDLLLLETAGFPYTQWLAHWLGGLGTQVQTPRDIYCSRHF